VIVGPHGPHGPYNWLDSAVRQPYQSTENRMDEDSYQQYLGLCITHSLLWPHSHAATTALVNLTKA
jgi:hypothetical protein